MILNLLSANPVYRSSLIANAKDQELEPPVVITAQTSYFFDQAIYRDQEIKLLKELGISSLDSLKEQDAQIKLNAAIASRTGNIEATIDRYNAEQNKLLEQTDQGTNREGTSLREVNESSDQAEFELQLLYALADIANLDLKDLFNDKLTEFARIPGFEYQQDAANN